MTIEKFENKLFNYKILRERTWEEMKGNKNFSAINTINKNEMLLLEQRMYDKMGEEGWIPAGWTTIPHNRTGEYYLIFSRIKE